eukprot:scaffold1060_cov196-Amphora_coffeaeformis.AAC.34
MKALFTLSAAMLSVTKYFERLKLDPTMLDAHPSIEKLQQLQESHLSHIPFENLAQHGCVGGPVVLDLEMAAAKILERRRGGFCLELNPLFGTFLRQIGYQVRFVLAHVFTPAGYRENPTHVFLIVQCQDDKRPEISGTYFADVGFGEPSLHPLDYTKFGVEQETPEGMKSKIVRNGDQVELYWLNEGSWQPRLKWSYEKSQSSVEMEDLERCLAHVVDPESIFSKKVITTRLTRTSKTTLAGSRFKVTGPPRFQDDGSQGTKETQRLDSVPKVQSFLEEKFGIPVSETQGLCLEKSNSADHEAVWSQF